LTEEFKKDFSAISKDPKIAEKLEENFHFHKLKTEAEKSKIMKRIFGGNFEIEDLLQRQQDEENNCE
tara:strand:+ start:358 stop:558 length:201 start_codon:yes stop_codon:yes gene_type:complete